MVTAPASAGGGDGGAEIQTYGFSLEAANLNHAGVWKCQVDGVTVDITVSSVL